MDKIRVTALLKNAFEQENVCGLIVHDENPAALDYFFPYQRDPFCSAWIERAGRLPPGNPLVSRTCGAFRRRPPKQVCTDPERKDSPQEGCPIPPFRP